MTLDDFFGPRRGKPVMLDDLRKPTHFPRCEAPVREALDEFLEAVRSLREDPDYVPDAGIRQRWIGQARKMVHGHGGHGAGFYLWAIEEHTRAFREQGRRVHITGPASVDYLWEAYERQRAIRRSIGVYCPDCATWHDPGEHIEEEE